MTEISGHQLASSTDCKIPGCPNESHGHTTGPYSRLCDEHIGEMRKRIQDGASNKGRSVTPVATASNGNASAAPHQDGLRDLMRLARKADRAAVRAAAAQDAARAAQKIAKKAADDYAEALRRTALQAVA